MISDSCYLIRLPVILGATLIFAAALHLWKWNVIPQSVFLENIKILFKVGFAFHPGCQLNSLSLFLNSVYQ